MQYILAKRDLPVDIVAFLNSVFEIYEIRGRVGQLGAIKFEVRSKEKNHTIPHVHATCNEFNISIAIETGEILTGNLPGKNEKIAVRWVLDHKDSLLSTWRDFAFSAKTSMSGSALALRR